MAEMTKTMASTGSTPEGAQPSTKEEVLAPKAAEAASERMVEVELSAPFWTNGEHFGPKKEYGDDEDPQYVTVRVPETVADDLKRRQREYDRARRDRFVSKRTGQFTPDQGPSL